MTVTLLLVYLSIGIIAYMLTDPRGVAVEIESQNWLVTFGEVDRALTVFAIGLWPIWLVLYFFLKK